MDKFPETADEFEAELVRRKASYVREDDLFFFRDLTPAHRFMYTLEPGTNCVFLRDVFDPDGKPITRISYV